MPKLIPIEQDGRYKLTLLDIEKIEKMLKANKRRQDIANLFNVSLSRIWQIANKKQYALNSKGYGKAWKKNYKPEKQIEAQRKYRAKLKSLSDNLEA